MITFAILVYKFVLISKCISEERGSLSEELQNILQGFAREKPKMLVIKSPKILKCKIIF
jgi:hypothetical protein